LIAEGQPLTEILASIYQPRHRTTSRWFYLVAFYDFSPSGATFDASNDPDLEVMTRQHYCRGFHKTLWILLMGWLAVAKADSTVDPVTDSSDSACIALPLISV